MEPNQFWQFSDQLRQQGSKLSTISLNDSIWSNSYRKTDDRKNFDARVGGGLNSFAKYSNNYDLKYNDSKGKASNWNGFDDGWNIAFPNSVSPYNDQLSQPSPNGNFNANGKGVNGQKMNAGPKKGKVDEMIEQAGKSGRKNTQKKNGSLNGDNNGDTKTGVDKRFKTLPQSEALPRNETIGGYIFVCNNDTMQENLQRQLFGLPPRYRDSVRAITPGLPLFLYNYSTHQLHGVYEASSFGGSNIDPTAWEDKKSAGESRFPAQVRVVARKTCEPLEEDAFRPILHHYDGPKFRLELSVPEALSLLDIFAGQRLD